jgi:acetyltransferase-like isoleucine patch superfamily enzyme
MKKNNELEELHSNLLLLHEKLRKEMKIKWDRVLPFEELLFDRWEKAAFLKSKSNANVYHNSYWYGDVKVGKNTWVGPFTILDGSAGKLKVGDFCSISSGVHIYTHNMSEWCLTGGKAKKQSGNVTIGDCCFIGPDSLIPLGIKIGKCSLIGAHSFVHSDIPPNSIAYGSPAKIVGKVKVMGNKVEYSYFKDKKSK